MIPEDSLKAIAAMLTSERITYKGSEILALNKVLNDVNQELNARAVAARTKLAAVPDLPLPVVDDSKAGVG